MSKKLFVQSVLARSRFGAWEDRVLMNPADDDTGAGGGAGGADGGADDSADDSGAGDDDKSTGDAGNGDAGGEKSGISDEAAKLLKEVMEKKGAIKDLKSQLERFSGVDIEKYNALIEAEEQRQKDASDAEKKRLEESGNFARLKEQILEENDKVVNSLKSEIEALKAENSALKGERVELSIGNAFSSSKFITNETNLSASKARIIYGAHFDVENGQVIPYDKPAGSAERTMLVDGRGEPLSFDNAMRKLVEADPDRDLLMRSKLKPGSGSDASKVPGSKSEKAADQGKGVHKITAGIADALAAAKRGKK